ncbi:hypothetical protein IFM89_031069 [Coptis chinensis]|uniref:glucan endo-1,3-beta-D-glucosidase n=1 Tax=Coptis chinensis TaxID=261450 RepID=A0A835HA26_9MAGN|nr:hypothetical protein IFM89_031069 [Coptis chinensis]
MVGMVGMVGIVWIVGMVRMVGIVGVVAKDESEGGGVERSGNSVPGRGLNEPPSVIEPPGNVGNGDEPTGVIEPHGNVGNGDEPTGIIGNEVEGNGNVGMVKPGIVGNVGNVGTVGAKRRHAARLTSMLEQDRVTMKMTMNQLRGAMAWWNSKIRLLIGGVGGSFDQTHSLGVGINYGQIANNLPSPSRVAALLQSVSISRVKLYDADPNVLTAFSNSDVEFIVGVGNENILNMTNPTNAQSWIQQNVVPHLPGTKITCITVGNEVFSNNDTQAMSNLLPAMQTIYNALDSLGLKGQVNVSTAHSLNILANSFPPSSGLFRQDLTQYIQPLVDFHSQTKSPFLINAYPFFAYKSNPNDVPLDYVLFQPNPGQIDPVTNLNYDNMLYAQIDAAYSAIEAMGHTDVELKISETGWPSMGDSDEVGATPENARIYNGNILQRIKDKQGTPMKPSVPIDVFVFALFNEDLKRGPASERNYGLFYPNCQPVYNIGLGGYLPLIASAYKTQVRDRTHQ